MIHFLKVIYHHARCRLMDNTLSMLLWLVNVYPAIGGFSIHSMKIPVIFMIILVSLQFYVFVVGTVAYLLYIAEDAIESSISFLNISIFGVIMNNAVWFLCKKNDLNQLLSLVVKNDTLLMNSGRFVSYYKKLIRRIKMIVIVCFTFHFINDILVFIPTRMVSMEKFAVVFCVGFDLTSSPSFDVCMLFLVIQELTAELVVAGYDAIVLFIFSHTTAVFQILYKEMESFKEVSAKYDTTDELTEDDSDKLKDIILRHSVLLSTVSKMQQIYSVSIGCGLFINAASLCVFFALPIEVSLSFGPLIYYTIFVFFLYCYYGQSLTNAAEKFEIAVYSCGWERLCVKKRKSILLILILAQQPVVVKAAGIIPISVYTFASVMQFIYKFVTIFKL